MKPLTRIIVFLLAATSIWSLLGLASIGLGKGMAKC
jgi:hypothetical protein